MQSVHTWPFSFATVAPSGKAVAVAVAVAASALAAGATDPLSRSWGWD